MAHELDFSNNRTNMAYTGAAAWHGLGHELTADADLETWRTEAGMNWRVSSTPLTFKDDAGAEQRFPDRQVLFRSDTKAALGVVSDDYKVVHPGDVMEFFRSLIVSHGYKMETAGCLYGGRKFWALARTGKSVTIMGQDVVTPYLMMATSCDGSMSSAAHPTGVRVVCDNTLRMAIGPDAKGAKIRIPHSAVWNAEEVHAQLGLVDGVWETFLGNLKQLASFKIGRDEAIQIIADELKGEWKTADGDDMNHDQMLEANQLLRRVMALHEGEGKGSDWQGSKGTAWGLINAVTEYCDHEAGSKTGDRSKAFERAHLGDRAEFKTRVANKLLELA